jgi:hypothetical protein
MDDLLNAMLSGAGSQGQGGQEEDDPMASLLGSLLGGSAGSPTDTGDLLSGLLGGGDPQGAGGGLEDMLGALMGGGSADMSQNAFLAPIAEGIAEKLGLPPQIAQLIVTFVIGKLLSGQVGGGRVPVRGSGLASDEGLDLDDLLGRMGSGQGLDSDFLQSSGLADELAEQAGLDPDTATQGLQEAFRMLGGQLGGGQAPQLGGLEDLFGS